MVLDGLDLDAMEAGFLLDNAHGNLIEGFLVRRYHEAGIWLRAVSSGNTIRKNVTTESPHHDGIQLLNSPQNLVEHNTSFANATPNLNACGINVTGSGSVGNIVRHNETFENDFGIQAAGGAANNVIFDNESHDNRRVGIRNIGSSNGTVIENNRVFDNGGIGQFGGILLSGSTGVTVARNEAFNNVPFDLFWDGVGANEFENNHCGTSSHRACASRPKGHRRNDTKARLVRKPLASCARIAAHAIGERNSALAAKCTRRGSRVPTQLAC